MENEVSVSNGNILDKGDERWRSVSNWEALRKENQS